MTTENAPRAMASYEFGNWLLGNIAKFELTNSPSLDWHLTHLRITSA
jgi:hypothetical protein